MTQSANQPTSPDTAMGEFADVMVLARTTSSGQVLSHERLGEVFEMVKPHPNWKMPIEATVPMTKATSEEIALSVVWFCGGAPEIEDRGDQWVVTGAGYYEWVGA